MELKHTFTVPASVEETWAAFEDIESVAACFPGATVTEVSGDDFKGTCKVKLGPIALVYTGTGTFVDKDVAGRKFVIEAKGKDKRGNGTAGATVTATMSSVDGDSGAGSRTEVDVLTDLAITGKPAQFGRGVIQDVSDKLLQQFVTCLESQVGAPAPADQTAGQATGTAPGVSPVETAPPAAGVPPAQAEATHAEVTAPAPADGAGAAAASAPAAPSAPTTPAAPSTASAPPRTTGAQERGSEDALDLGATVLPVLARTYGPQVLAGLLLLLVGYLLGRRRSHG